MLIIFIFLEINFFDVSFGRCQSIKLIHKTHSKNCSYNWPIISGDFSLLDDFYTLYHFWDILNILNITFYAQWNCDNVKSQIVLEPVQVRSQAVCPRHFSFTDFIDAFNLIWFDPSSYQESYYKSPSFELMLSTGLCNEKKCELKAPTKQPNYE